MIQWEIIEKGIVRIPGQVDIEYHRSGKGALMDWDNLASTSKLFMDALVKCGVIEDDSPKFIPEMPAYSQSKGDPSTIIKIKARQ